MIDEDVTIWKKELQEFLKKYKIPTNEELIFLFDAKTCSFNKSKPSS